MENTKISRIQKRHIDRVEREASETHSKLSEKFLNEFINSTDPEGEEMKELYRIINAKWRAYCSIKKFNPIAFTAVEESMNRVIKEYTDAKIPV